jgi:hypothetical protein
MSANQPGIPHVPIPAPANPGGSHPDPEDLVLFALQLFPPEQAATIAAHLQQCPECRAEFGRIHGDLAIFASTVDPHSPPESSRQRLIQQVAREKKIVSTAQPQPKPQPAPEPQPQSIPLASFGRSASILNIEDRQPRHRIGSVIFAAAGWAVAAGFAIAFGLQFKGREDMKTTNRYQGLLLQRFAGQATSAHQLMDALTDPNAVRVTLTTKPQPKPAPIGGVTYNPEKGSLIFLASNLDPLQAYKTYELWVIPADGTSPIPAGTFHPDDQGNANVIMPDLPKGVSAKAFGVTIEDQGGAPTPTPPIIMAGS